MVGEDGYELYLDETVAACIGADSLSVAVDLHLIELWPQLPSSLAPNASLTLAGMLRTAYLFGYRDGFESRAHAAALLEWHLSPAAEAALDYAELSGEDAETYRRLYSDAYRRGVEDGTGAQPFGADPIVHLRALGW